MHLRAWFLFPLAAGLARGELRAPSAALSRDEIGDLITLNQTVTRALRSNYYPDSRLGADFDVRTTATEQALARARSLDEGHEIIADALRTFDPRVRFYPPVRNVRVDYSWSWTLVGDAGFVTGIDRVGDARAKGLQLGDRILELEGVPFRRDTFQYLYHTLLFVAPRGMLHVLAQSPGQEPRRLAIAATIRPQRATRTTRINGEPRLEWIRSEKEKIRHRVFEDLSQHLHRVGPVLVWHLDDLHRDPANISAGLAAARDATGLVLDVRGQYVARVDTVLRLLDGLFTRKFDVATIRQSGPDRTLHVDGRADAFPGTVLVLTDAATGGYAELLVHVIQQKQRGVIIGDRTLGRCFDEATVSYARGPVVGLNVGGLRVPHGELVLADGARLDGRGVAPDLQCLPKPADLAAERDIVLPRALQMLKQTLSPEAAGQLFRPEPDDEADAH